MRHISLHVLKRWVIIINYYLPIIFYIYIPKCRYNCKSELYNRDESNFFFF